MKGCYEGERIRQGELFDTILQVPLGFRDYIIILTFITEMENQQGAPGRPWTLLVVTDAEREYS
jgi:hypothetical protein